MVFEFGKKSRALTLTEMIVAMAILVIVMAAILPQIHCIQKSWAYNQNNTEVLQNGRVLIDHISSNLTQAARVTSVSNSTASNGYIEYLDNDGNTMRYDLNAGYVEFGRNGSLSKLAGPATQLRFACSDINSPDTLTTDPNHIRIVNVTALFPDPNSQSSKSFTTTAFIRTNALGSSGSVGPRFTFDAVSGKDPTLCGIDASHYLCAYEGSGTNGYAAVLSINMATKIAMLISSYQFDSSNGQTPALAKIDTTHYLCAYEGPNNDGWVVILQINPSTWAITKGTPFEYDTSDGQQPALAQIDTTHYLCTYKGVGGNGWAVILTVNIGAGTITKGTAFQFDSYNCVNPVLAKIDAAHYLCVYTGKNTNGYAAILVPNISSSTVTQATSFIFDSSNCTYPALAQIDTSHYLCTYAGSGNDGFAVILTISIMPPAIARSTPYEFDIKNGEYSSLMKIDSSRYLCVYQTDKSVGEAVILTADAASAKISKESSFPFDNNRCVSTALCQADTFWFLCAYQGTGDNGYAIMVNTDLHVTP